MSEIPDDLGVGLSGGVPVPFLWERNGRTVRIMLVGQAAADVMLAPGWKPPWRDVLDGQDAE